MIKIESLSQTKALFDYLEKKRNNQKFAKSIEISASFILITFFMLFAIRPTAYTIASLLGEIKSKEALSQQKLKPKIQNIVKAQQNFALIQQDYHLIDASLPDTPSYSHLATQLLGAGYQSQIPFSSLNITFDKNKNSLPKQNLSGQFSSYQVSLSELSNFPAALSFLNQISNNRRLLEISKISLARNNKDKENSDQINLSFSIKVPYWQTYEKK